MGWIEAYVVWEGALDEEREFPLDGSGLDAWADGVIAEAKDKGDHADVYIIAHDHPRFSDGEDVCVQYLTDHSPYRTTGEDVILEPGDPDVWLEETGRPCSGDDCDRCHAVPAQAYRVVCEHGCYDDGAWRYCGTCARIVAQGHVKFCEGWES